MSKLENGAFDASKSFKGDSLAHGSDPPSLASTLDITSIDDMSLSEESISSVDDAALKATSSKLSVTFDNTLQASYDPKEPPIALEKKKILNPREFAKAQSRRPVKLTKLSSSIVHKLEKALPTVDAAPKKSPDEKSADFDMTDDINLYNIIVTVRKNSKDETEEQLLRKLRKTLDAVLEIDPKMKILRHQQNTRIELGVSRLEKAKKSSEYSKQVQDLTIDRHKLSGSLNIASTKLWSEIKAEGGPVLNYCIRHNISLLRTKLSRPSTKPIGWLKGVNWNSHRRELIEKEVNSHITAVRKIPTKIELGIQTVRIPSNQDSQQDYEFKGLVVYTNVGEEKQVTNALMSTHSRQSMSTFYNVLKFVPMKTFAHLTTDHLQKIAKKNRDNLRKLKSDIVYNLDDLKPKTKDVVSPERWLLSIKSPSTKWPLFYSVEKFSRGHIVHYWDHLAEEAQTFLQNLGTNSKTSFENKQDSIISTGRSTASPHSLNYAKALMQDIDTVAANPYKKSIKLAPSPPVLTPQNSPTPMEIATPPTRKRATPTPLEKFNLEAKKRKDELTEFKLTVSQELADIRNMLTKNEAEVAKAAQSHHDNLFNLKREIFQALVV